MRKSTVYKSVSRIIVFVGSNGVIDGDQSGVFNVADFNCYFFKQEPVLFEAFQT